MDLDIAPASDGDYGVACNLARFYFYDMAEHAGWPFPENGLFDIGDHFAPYWGKPAAKSAWPAAWRGFAFVVRVDGHPAGFALVQQHGEMQFDMGEFFIGRQYRRNAVGQRVATAMFDRFAGHWQVREMPTNVAAQAFWRKIIADYTGSAFTETQAVFPEYGSKEFVVQRFKSAA